MAGKEKRGDEKRSSKEKNKGCTNNRAKQREMRVGQLALECQSEEEDGKNDESSELNGPPKVPFFSKTSSQ